MWIVVVKPRFKHVAGGIDPSVVGVDGIDQRRALEGFGNLVNDSGQAHGQGIGFFGGLRHAGCHRRRHAEALERIGML